MHLSHGSMQFESRNSQPLVLNYNSRLFVLHRKVGMQCRQYSAFETCAASVYARQQRSRHCLPTGDRLMRPAPVYDTPMPTLMLPAEWGNRAMQGAAVRNDSEIKYPEAAHLPPLPRCRRHIRSSRSIREGGVEAAPIEWGGISGDPRGIQARARARAALARGRESARTMGGARARAM